MHDHAAEEHDLGLHHDLKVMTALMERRRLLGFLATGGAGALLAACGGGGGSSGSTTAAATTTTTTTTTTPTTTTTTTTTPTTTGACVADPTETNGPFPSDGTNSVNGTISNSLATSGVVRSDVRPSFGGVGSATAAGVPVVFTIKLVNTNASCATLSGYAIYIWQCDRDGKYSLYSSGVQGENYLRGVQVTDANGQVTFTTIFPAAYDGRWPHIHFEVFTSLANATSQRTAILTSQFAMPSDIANAVFSQATGYSASVANMARVSLTSDGVFGDNTAAQIAAMTPTFAGSVTAGFTATATVGVAR